MTCTSGGCCTSAQTFLFPLVHPLTLRLPLFHEYLLCWWSETAAALYVHMYLPSCFLPPENSNTNQQLSSKQRCDTQVQPHGSQIRCNSEEPFFCCSHRSRFSTIIKHRRSWVSVSLILHRPTESWGFTPDLLLCLSSMLMLMGADGGVNVPRLPWNGLSQLSDDRSKCLNG